MTQIKSEKAKEYLDEKGYTMYGEPVICLTSATKAIIIAETEAEERHAKELQELKDKAVEVFKISTPFGEDDSCYKMFIKLLNEK